MKLRHISILMIFYLTLSICSASGASSTRSSRLLS